jgi:hypothetical protein
MRKIGFAILLLLAQRELMAQDLTSWVCSTGSCQDYASAPPSTTAQVYTRIDGTCSNGFLPYAVGAVFVAYCQDWTFLEADAAPQYSDTFPDLVHASGRSYWWSGSQLYGMFEDHYCDGEEVRYHPPAVSC